MVKVKAYLADLQQHCKRFTKNWDYYIIGSDAYLAGYRMGKNNNSEEIVEIEESKDGEHQLTPRSFAKWKKKNYSVSLEEAMNVYLPMFKFKEIRIVEDNNGMVSFQGIGERVKLSEDFKFNDVD